MDPSPTHDADVNIEFSVDALLLPPYDTIACTDLTLL